MEEKTEYYKTRFHSGLPREEPRFFDSPTFDDAVQGSLALIDTTIREFPEARGVSVKIYRVTEPGPSLYLVSEVKIENRVNWHPARKDN